MLPGSKPGASKCPFLMPARLPNNNNKPVLFSSSALCTLCHFRNYCHLCTLQPLCALPALSPLPALGGQFVHLEPNHLLSGTDRISFQACLVPEPLYGISQRHSMPKLRAAMMAAGCQHFGTLCWCLTETTMMRLRSSVTIASPYPRTRSH